MKFAVARERRRNLSWMAEDKPAWRKDAFSMLLDHRFWARHPAPFNKTKPGRDRRAERLMKLKFRKQGICQHDPLQD